MDTNVPKRDRATSEPGGCECDECGTIFIGGLEHNITSKAYQHALGVLGEFEG